MSCTTINATSDSRLEEDELYMFTLQSFDPEIEIGNISITIVTVIDETGECNP